MKRKLFRVLLNNTYPATVLYEGFSYTEACAVLEQSWSTRYMTKTEVEVPPASDVDQAVNS